MCKNQNYNKRSLIATLVVLAVCLVIVTGSTFSLFTSKTGVNIAVTAANVKLTATINQSSLELSSMGNKLEGNTFENGGKADFNANFTGLDLTYITPGDKATFTIDLVNTSNVNIQYRVTWKLTNAEGDTLANYLNVIVGDKKLELNAPTSEWTLWEPSNNAEDMTKSIKVSVEFPTNLWADETDEVRYANYRELMNNIANIEFAVEAVQGNGTYAFTAFVNSEAGLQNAINAGATHIVLTAPIELTRNLQIGASKQGKSGGAAETPVVDGILIDLNGHAITAAEDVDAGIANSEDVTFVNGTIAVNIANTGSVVAREIDFVNCTVTSDGNEASFEKDDTCTGNVVAAEFYDINGVTYYWDSVSDKQTLYLVPSDYEGHTVEVADGTYAIGNYAFAYNNNVKTVILAGSVRDLGRGFDSSAVEKVVLNEGLTTISARAFRSTTALKEVEFSSTVTVIEDNAFQKSAIKEIVIPASVTTVGEAAFGASLIEKVTFEGNTNIEGFAFRGCTKLNTVILNGMDVNFVASRLNGRNNCWFCNGESNNPGTSNITFYVKTNVIKERVLTAMGAERNNTPVNVEMTKENGYDVDEKGIAYVYTAEALKAALADGKSVVMACDITVAATAGGYGPVGITVDGQILDGNGHTLTVTGANSTWACAIYVKGGKIQNIVVAGAMRGIFTGGTTADIYLNNVSFNNVIYTYNSDAGNKEYGVYATDCTFNGWTSFSNCHKEVVFTNCTFTKGSGYEFCRPYNAVVFNNCNFTEGYEFDTSCSNSIVLNNCTYGNTAITIQNANTLGIFYKGINNTSINGVNYVAGGYHVDANGVAYVSTADALKAAVANEKSIVMLNDITIAASKGGYSVAGIVVNGQTVDGNGHTLTVTGANSTWDCGIYITGGTVKNLVVKGAFRGIFTAGSSFDIYLNNVSFQNVVYTFSSDNGNGQNGVYATDCTFNGWTSYSNVYEEVVFTDCTFTEGSGYAFCRPYNATKFVDCTFTEGYKLDTSKVSGLVFNNCTYSDGLFYNGYNGAIFNGGVCVCTADELIAAINAAKDGAIIYLAAGDYALRFTNNTSFNVNNLTIKGMGNVNLAISSSEAWYGRVQGSNVTFENIHFTSSVGATGKATYKNCTFDSWAICASSNNEETYFNNCVINGCLNTSTDFSSGDVSVKDCQIVKAEYSGSMTMNFENCQIGEVIIWNSNTNFTNCKYTTLNVDNVTTATVTIK